MLPKPTPLVTIYVMAAPNCAFLSQDISSELQIYNQIHQTVGGMQHVSHTGMRA